MSSVCVDFISEDYLHEQIMQGRVVGHCDYCQSEENPTIKLDCSRPAPIRPEGVP